MELRSADFKRQAKGALTNKWGIAILTFFVASLLGGTSGLPSFNFNIDLEDFNLDRSSIGIIGGADVSIVPLLTSLLIPIITTALITAIVFFCVGSIVNVGYSHFNLDVIDGNELKLEKIFSFFKYWTKAIVCALLTFLYVFLWSLLFIIPGIMAAYSYALAPYILAENPDITPTEAITRSKEIMYGNRWRLFCLNFSFIGWNILSVFTLGILSLWIEPWRNASVAAFYRSLVPLPSFNVDEAESEQDNNDFGPTFI